MNYWNKIKIYNNNNNNNNIIIKIIILTHNIVLIQSYHIIIINNSHKYNKMHSDHSDTYSDIFSLFHCLEQSSPVRSYLHVGQCSSGQHVAVND